MPKPIAFTYQQARCDAPQLDTIVRRLSEYQQTIIQGLKSGYDSDYASLALLDDAALHTQVQAVIDQKKRLNPTVLVVIGIGGSNLGTLAVHQACYGSLYNEHSALKVYYADTVDADRIQDVLRLVERELQQQRSVLLNLISKSGSTTESVANFEIFLSVLQRYCQNYQEYVVVTTDADSPLWNLAQANHFTCLAIANKVGGRYSVMSAVGLFPLGMIGIDIQALVQGARHARDKVLSTIRNPAAMSAAYLWHHAQQGTVIHDTFLFSPDLENMGKWYRQLLAESIGKVVYTDGQEVAVGMIPTVSIGSTDLHSMAQLYLSGKRPLCTTFVEVGSMTDLTVPEFPDYDALVNNIQGKHYATLMQAIIKGTQQAYTNNACPFVTWQLPEKSSYYCGQWMQYKMMEIIYLGFLYAVNPFDQPQVELYKQETRKLLADE